MNALLRIDQVCDRVGLRKTTIYKLLAEGSFPRPVRLSARTTAWHAGEIDTWIAERVRVVTPASFRAAALDRTAPSPTSTR
jgi:prophage regulatory protein